MNTEDDEFKRIEAEAKRQTPCKGTSMKEKTKELADSVGAVYPTLFLGRHDGVLFTETELETFVELVAAAEREACAKVCESRITLGTGSVAILNGAADAIKARGNT